MFASGRSAMSDLPTGRWDVDVFYRAEGRSQWQTPTTRGGYIRGFSYDWRRHKIPPKQIEQATPLQFMILDAVDQAIQQAGYHERPLRRTEVGVVVGTVFGGEFSSQLCVALRLPEVQELMADLLRRNGVPSEQIATLMQSYAQTLLKRMPALLDETGSFTASALASRITKSFDLMGGAVAVDAGRASSMAALNCCIDQLRSGDCEMMICVGGQQDMSATHFMQLAGEQRLALGETRSPFDAEANGVLPGEGCGALLLKRLGDARRDGDPILGILRGIGAASDPGSIEASKHSIARASRDAQLKTSFVAAIETAPTGDVANDAAEAEAIADGYRDKKSSTPIWLGTAVTQLGDTGGASAMISLLKGAMELDAVNIPAAAGLETPATFITRQSATLAVPREDSALKANDDGRLIVGIHSGGRREVAYHVLLERGTPLKPTDRDTNANAEPTREASSSSNHRHGKIVYFDATTRRRERLRVQSEPQKSGRVVEPVTPRVSRAASNDEVAAKRQAATTPEPVVATSPQAMPPAAAAKPVETVTAEKTQSLDAGELETFLVNFVVEQTGYPTDLVELDADLEADLGIDSIKKAQLFGELGEYFDVQPSEDLTLDDFTTLRHVLNFLLTAQVGITQPLSTTPAQTVSPPKQSAPTPTTPKLAPAASTSPPIAAPVPPPVDEESPVALTEKFEGGTLDPLELETFLVNFVIEQTGYPADLVELDADLEADLGIDSIKKAQLFGELGEYFDVQPSEDLTLDDFTTLRHVLNFLLKAQAGSPAPAKPR